MDHRTHRRAVLATGAKLAYAAPVVAASMQIGSQHGIAASPPLCPDGYVRSCGTVLDAETNLPIAGIAYAGLNVLQTVYSDENGVFDGCRAACCRDHGTLSGVPKQSGDLYYCMLFAANGDEHCESVFHMRLQCVA